ncbi:MAG TPA: hypothetical protein HA311_05775, partial [Candidatus Poseidoniaceae archaeon]|nr:hypothetical protein [Candidatus Poseidoniaceae archaeon]
GGVTLSDAAGATSWTLSSSAPSVTVTLVVTADAETMVGDHGMTVVFTDAV